MSLTTAMRHDWFAMGGETRPYFESPAPNWIVIDWAFFEQALADAEKTPEQVAREICEGE